MIVCILTGIAVAVLVALLTLNHIAAAAYAPAAEEWPPIDDDEFVRRCPPGVSRSTALGVRRVVSSALGVRYEQVYPEHRLVEDLGAE